MDILVLNCGSSSAKFAVIDSETGKEKASGLAERLGAPGSQLVVKNDGSKSERALPENASHEQALRAVVEVLHELGLAEGIKGVGHRVVHGGATFNASVAVDASVKRDIEACFRLAPLHNPPNLTGIEVAEELFPTLTNVAVFDTAFHASMPRKAYMYAVPYELYEQQGVRRYGFHGTSHRYVAGKALEALGLTDDPDSGLVTAHLGNGCSATAVAGGRSVDTSMGLTPLEGLVMGTRSGDIDPALIGYLEDNKGWSAKETITVLNKKSGLLGLS
ncbi:MAG: acetate/propionate family kinase, partial [Planctomycetota bacterium]